jgi:hypothetical protein
MANTLCRHCRKTIVYDNNPYGGYWFHPHSQSVWCEIDDTSSWTRAEP